MKILLVGEYSRLHNSLKEGLQELGHEVVILGFRDGFKDFPVDFPLERQWNSGLLKKLKVGLYKVTGFDMTSWLTYRQFWKIRTKFTGFDTVQIINENSFYCDSHYEKKILGFLFKNNSKAFLLSCGTDYWNTRFYFENPGLKSVIQPYHDGKISKKDFYSVLKYRKESYRKLHEFIYANIAGVIASDIDYQVPLLGHPKYLGLIPNPVNVSTIAFRPMDLSGKIHIFHGINTENYFKKGSDYFEEAVAIIQKKYPEKVSVSITRSLPYAEYIKAYDDCHILLDQTYARDQGYNALEAMAKGKVVFTGAETEFTDYYNLTGRVAVNAIPQAAQVVADLEFLIRNPGEISAIGKRARTFVETEHDYRIIAQKYLATWTNTKTNGSS
jgi:glycosyltransferase involved in cell wall biosynthesis